LSSNRLFLCLLFTALLAVQIGCVNAQAETKVEVPDYDVIVIGAGMGGLSAGAHLATAGMRVLVLEQHHKVGGCTTSWSRGEFNFDNALHEMAGGGSGDHTLVDLLKMAGVYDKIELIRINPLYRSILPGVDFTMPADFDEAQAALIERWPEERDGIIAFHQLMKKIGEATKDAAKLYRKSSAAMIPLGMKHPVLLKYLRADLQSILDKHFTDETLKAVISQFWVYYGPPPPRLWAIMFMSANYSYLTKGAYQVKGSSQALSNAYAERITELGGVVKTGNLVTKIMIEDDRVKGVQTASGDTYTSRYVVSNADPFQTFFKLVGEEKTPKGYAKRIRSMEKGVSLVGVYLGLDVTPAKWNNTDHEIFYSTSLDNTENYNAMVEGRYSEAAVAITFYSNLGDPFYSPPGKSVLVLHAYADIKDWPTEREAYQQKKQKAAEELIGLAENVFPGVSKHIQVMEVITPRTLEAFTMQKDGIPYGWQFTPEQGMRLKNQTPIEGLYLASSWTNPGHGVSTAQISGFQASRLILDEEGVE
jgi:phytoene dehydrogenase-like protein